jgi:hypothetical protein
MSENNPDFSRSGKSKSPPGPRGAQERPDRRARSPANKNESITRGENDLNADEETLPNPEAANHKVRGNRKRQESVLRSGDEMSSEDDSAVARNTKKGASRAQG